MKSEQVLDLVYIKKACVLINVLASSFNSF